MIGIKGGEAPSEPLTAEPDTGEVTPPLVPPDELPPDAPELVLPEPVNHCATPPWCEHVPDRVCENEYVPSLQSAVAPGGASNLDPLATLATHSPIVNTTSAAACRIPLPSNLAASRIVHRF